jgi:hypothetical protein
MKWFLDPNLPDKKLWRNLGMRETVDDNIIFTPDQMNTFFATPQTIRPNNTDFDSAYDSPTEELAFISTFELEVYIAIHQIRSNAVGADGIPFKILKIILPHILPYVTHILIPSLCHPAIQRRGNYQKLCQWQRPTIQVVSRTIGLLVSCQLCLKEWN